MQKVVTVPVGDLARAQGPRLGLVSRGTCSVLDRQLSQSQKPREGDRTRRLGRQSVQWQSSTQSVSLTKRTARVAEKLRPGDCVTELLGCATCQQKNQSVLDTCPKSPSGGLTSMSGKKPQCSAAMLMHSVEKGKAGCGERWTLMSSDSRPKTRHACHPRSRGRPAVSESAAPYHCLETAASCVTTVRSGCMKAACR